MQGEKQFREMCTAKGVEWRLKEHAAHKIRLSNAKPTIDDDVEDDATGGARTKLKLESAARRQEQAASLEEANKRDFEHLSQVESWTSTRVSGRAEGEQSTEAAPSLPVGTESKGGE